MGNTKSVTVSGEICTYQNSLSHLDYQRRRFGAPFSDISRGVCRRGPSRRSIRVRRPDLSGLGEAPALARRWNGRWKSLLGIKMDSDLGVFFGPVQDLEKVRFLSCANLLFKITQPFKNISRHVFQNCISDPTGSAPGTAPAKKSGRISTGAGPGAMPLGPVQNRSRRSC